MLRKPPAHQQTPVVSFRQFKWLDPKDCLRHTRSLCSWQKCSSSSWRTCVMCILLCWPWLCRAWLQSQGLSLSVEECITAAHCPGKAGGQGREIRSLGLKRDHHPLQTHDTVPGVQACFRHDVQVLILNMRSTRSNPLFEKHLEVGVMAMSVTLESNMLMLRKDSVQLGQHCPGERGYRNGKDVHQKPLQPSTLPSAMWHGKILQEKTRNLLAPTQSNSFIAHFFPTPKM